MQNPSTSQSENSKNLPWTIIRLLRWTTSYFTSYHVEDPRASAEILLAHTLKLRRIDLYMQHDQPLRQDELDRFKSLIIRRRSREPVAYIVGDKAFWSLELKVTRDVLIPRPETECLVEAVLAVLPPSDVSESSADTVAISRRILELGTGSGAIILALASERPNHLFFAADASSNALAVAWENALCHHLDRHICFFAGNWFSPLTHPLTHEERFDVIVSNPPYIRTSDIDALQPEIHKYEPIMALDGGQDGLDAIGHIIRHAGDYLKKGGSLFLEIGHAQKADVRNLASACGCYEYFECLKDYSGHDRVVHMRRV